MGVNRLLFGARLLTLLLVASLLAACGTAPAPQQSAANAGPEPAVASTTGAVEVGTTLPITVTNYDGTTTQITDISRIVSLTGDVTEIIFALDMGQNVVGVDTSATYPPAETKALPSIGYQRRLSAEGILALQPTLVLGQG